MLVNLPRLSYVPLGKLAHPVRHLSFAKGLELGGKSATGIAKFPDGKCGKAVALGHNLGRLATCAATLSSGIFRSV
jgi:hypothetical protein